MRPDKPIKTESTFTSNSEVKRFAGQTNIKRDGSVKDISIALYDVDYAIKWHIENTIQPTITEENKVITVPVLFANGEKWAAVQKHGYLRDNQGKLLTPMIMIKRNSVSKREDIQDLKVLETQESRITFEKKYSAANRYDRFSLSNKTPVKEYYSMDVPKFVQIEYELLIWTNNSIQLNEIIEQLIWFDGKAFGDAHKFITHIDAPSFESVNSTGEDRLVKASMGMRTKAHILNTHGPNAPSLYKLNPVNRLVIALEVDSHIEKTTSNVVAPSMQSTAIQPVLGAGVNRGGNSNVSAALIYINTNSQLTGTVLNTTIVSFASGWIQAPASLPATSIDNFIFYANGALIERTAISSFTTSGATSTLTIIPENLGYSLESGDEIIGIGKFINQDR
jgi:glutaredoxin